MRRLEEVLSVLPEPAKVPLRMVRNGVIAAWYRGSARYCPVCENTSRRFRPYGVQHRPEARCSRCGALERHRLLWLFLQKRTSLFDGSPKKMLHVAPEWFLEPKFRAAAGEGYLTADLFNPRTMVKMDITDIQYPDESFDVIYCSHVLEHVPEDRKAMREFHRVLKKDGWAILLVPITTKETYEDFTITDPKERLEAFGQEDHVRKYGPDYVDRLREAGFTVEVSRAVDLVGEEDINRMALKRSGSIYYCTK